MINMSLSSSSSSSAVKAKPYLIIDISGNGNTKPFKNALTPNKQKKGTKAPPKTLYSTMLYIFKARVDGIVYWKIGETFDPATYHSKARYCPMIEYEGVVQILHFGKPLEMLLHRYFDQTVGNSFKGSEWYANAGVAVDNLLAAMRANEEYNLESANVMVGVSTDFPLAYTCGYSSKVDGYLTLFRVRYKDRLYRLTAENMEQTIGKITDEQFAVSPPVVPPAPAVPSISNGSEPSDGEESDEESEDEEEDDE